MGKSTVVRRLRSDVPDLFFSVSMTTRAPRPGEVDGEDYIYVTREQFEVNLDENGAGLSQRVLNRLTRRAG